MAKKILYPLLLVSGLTGTAQAVEPEELSSPTPLQFGEVRAKTDSYIALIEAGKATQAVNQIAAEHRLFAEKKSELANVANQFNNAVSLYGPVKQCVPYQQDYKSSLRITTTYVCQLDDALIYWEFQADHLQSGWVITNFSFNDTF